MEERKKVKAFARDENGMAVWAIREWVGTMIDRIDQQKYRDDDDNNNCYYDRDNCIIVNKYRLNKSQTNC